MNYHFVWLRNGYEMHLSPTFETVEKRDRAAAQFFYGTPAQVRVDIWPGERESADSPLTLGPRYEDSILEELAEAARDFGY